MNPLLLLIFSCTLISDQKRSDLVDPDDDGVSFELDCDDANPAVYPGAEEICGDGLKNDCDSTKSAATELCGPASSLADADASMTGTESDQFLSYAVLGGVDLSGDGAPDLAAGVPMVLESAPQKGGQVWISREAFSDVRIMLSSEEACEPGASCDEAGHALAAADLDEDGYADLLVGAPWTNSAEDEFGFTGRAYVVRGPVTESGSLSEADLKLQPEADGNFGNAITVYRGVEGEEPIVVISALYMASGEDRVGAVWFLPWSDDMEEEDPVVEDLGVAAYGGVGNGWAGSSVANAGDVDGDGDDELIVGGSQIIAEEGYNEGEAWLVQEPPTEHVTLSGNGIRWAGASAGDGLGAAVAGAGDPNGDGYADVFLGAPGVDDGGASGGAVYLILGSKALDSGAIDARAEATLLGVSGSAAGWSLSNAGHTDDDNVDDLLVGTPYVNMSDEALSGYLWDGCLTQENDGGAMLVPGDAYSGKVAIQVIASLALSGEKGSTCTGYAVSGAGDQDGDGHDDLLIGSLGGGDKAGAAYLVLMTTY